MIITSIKMPKNCNVPDQFKNLNNITSKIPVAEIHMKSLFFSTQAYPKKIMRANANTIS